MFVYIKIPEIPLRISYKVHINHTRNILNIYINHCHVHGEHRLYQLLVLIILTLMHRSHYVSDCNRQFLKTNVYFLSLIKSEKEKHIKNIHDFKFLLPMSEYHNQTWTWRDFAMFFKNDSRKVIIGQVQ